MSADLLLRLMEAGTPMALIAEVAERLADASAAERILTKRRTVDRERKVVSNPRIPRNSTEDAESAEIQSDTPLPAPAPSFPPDPQTNPTPTHTPGETPRARGACRLADDWKPQKLDRSTVSGGIVENRGQEWAKRALESFKNHWRSANGPNARKRDWQAAFANWVIEQDNRDGRPRTTNGLGRHQPGAEARIVGAGRDFIARGAVG